MSVRRPEKRTEKKPLGRVSGFSGRYGFSLIELLVVIAIIGVLATIAVIAYGDIRKKAREVKRASDIKAIHNAIELYRDNNDGRLPDETDTLYCLGATSCWVDATNNATVDAAIRQYLNPIPLDPLPTRLYGAYVYRSPGRYWNPAPVGTVNYGPGSYQLAWKPEVPDSSNPPAELCEQYGGILAAWDNPPGASHCPPGGSCRQCGRIY